MSNLLQAVMKQLGVVQTCTTPWRPQSDGMVERMNRTLEAMLRQYVAEDHRDWDRWLPHCAWAYRSSIHSSTKFTPNKIMLGREVRMPLDLLLPHPEKDEDDGPENIEDYVENLHTTMQHVFDQVRENLAKPQFTRRKIMTERRPARVSR